MGLVVNPWRLHWTYPWPHSQGTSSCLRWVRCTLTYNRSPTVGVRLTPLRRVLDEVSLVSFLTETTSEGSSTSCFRSPYSGTPVPRHILYKFVGALPSRVYSTNVYSTVGDSRYRTEDIRGSFWGLRLFFPGGKGSFPLLSYKLRKEVLYQEMSTLLRMIRSSSIPSLSFGSGPVARPREEVAGDNNRVEGPEKILRKTKYLGYFWMNRLK